MNDTFVDNLRKYFENKGITQKNIAETLNVGPAYINKLLSGKKGFGKKTAQQFQDLYGLSASWLLTGEGDMLKKTDAPECPQKLEKHLNETPQERVLHTDSIPYFKEIPVSAGRAALMDVENEENAVGFIKIAGVNGKMAFPVVGCSMEPVIHAGDIVVVDEINSWDRIDPDKIYLIFTHEDRMIKHLETDEENDEILWCVSPNYKRFTVSKAEILKIYKVTFYGRLV